MSDPEIDKINEKKMKAKGKAVIKEREQVYNPEQVLFAVLRQMKDEGLAQMNFASSIETQILNFKQRKLNEKVEG